MIKEFFHHLDEAWQPLGSEPILLPVIGSVALFLQCEYERGTKDSDILEIEAIAEGKKLLKLAGKGSEFAAKHRIYLEILKKGIPFLPAQPLFTPIDALNRSLKNFRINALSITDTVVSKLKPFRPQDQEDIKATINLKLLDPNELLERFLLAKERWLLDARASELPSYVKNLHRVQRDFLGVAETKIELPGWLENV